MKRRKLSAGDDVDVDAVPWGLVCVLISFQADLSPKDLRRDT